VQIILLLLKRLNLGGVGGGEKAFEVAQEMKKMEIIHPFSV
jgi:hypothetical protein